MSYLYLILFSKFLEIVFIWIFCLLFLSAGHWQSKVAGSTTSSLELLSVFSLDENKYINGNYQTQRLFLTCDVFKTE